MNSNLHFNKLFENAKQQLSQGRSFAYIEKRIKELKLDASLETELLKQIKIVWHKKRSTNGTIMSLVGMVLLLIGFICSIIMHSNGSNTLDIPLYGITSIGAICLIIGLYLIFT